MVYKNEVRCKYSTQISGRKNAFSGHFVVVNWSEQLAVMQVMELLFSFHLQGLCMPVCVCVCQSKREAWVDMRNRHNGRKYTQMMVRMKETSSQSTAEGSGLGVLSNVTHFYI